MNGHSVTFAEVPNPNPVEAHIELIQATCSYGWQSKARETVGPVNRSRRIHIDEVLRAALAAAEADS
jgi:hypothetical protein